MKFTRLEVKGIGPHHDTEIDIPSGGMIAVTGNTGAGKSTLFGSIAACLYGTFPDGPRINQSLTANGDGKARICVTFSHRGSVYTAERVIASTVKATLTKDGDLVAGPKVKDFEEYIDRLTGGRDLCDAIWFAARKPRIDLVQSIPSERRRLFGQLIGFEELDALSKKFREDAAVSEREASIQRAGIPDIEELRQEIERNESIASAIEHRLGNLRSEKNESENALRHAEKDLLSIGDAVDIDNKKSAKESADARHNDANYHLANIRDAYDQNLKLAEKLPAAELAAEKLRVGEGMLAELQEQEKAADVYTQWTQRLSRIDDKLENAKKTFQDMHVIEPTEKTFVLADQIEDLSLIMEDAELILNESYKSQAAIEADGKSVKNRLEELRRRASKKPDTPADDAVCARCPLMVEWAGIDNQIADLERERDDLLRLYQEKRDLIVDRKDLLNSSRQQLEQAKQCREAITRYEDAKKRVENLEKTIGLYEQERNDCIDSAPPFVASSKDEMIELNNHIRQYAMQSANMDAMKNAAERLPDVKREVAEYEEKVDFLRAEAERCAEAYRQTVEAAKSTEEARANAQNKIDGLKNKVEELSRSIDESVSDTAKANANADNARQQIEKASKKYEEAKRIDKLAEEQRFLGHLYSNRGVQPIILDQYLPRLDDLMNDILDEMTEGQLRCAWRTQKETSKGDLAEGLYIEVFDINGPRDACLCSGGEEQAVQVALRISLNIWMQELKGQSFETLIIDEAGNNTDDDVTRRLYGQIEKVASRFGSVILITPKSEAASLCSRRVRIDRSGPVVTTRLEGV